MHNFSSRMMFNYDAKSLSQYHKKRPMVRFFIESGSDSVFFDTDATHAKVINRMTSQRRDGKTFTEYHHYFINWLYNFQDDWIFFDIGGNLGLYTFIASKLRNIKSYVFEPEINNACHINNTTYINRLTERVSCLPIALGVEDKWLRVRSPQIEPGHSGASIAEHNSQGSSNYPQFVFQTSIDSLLSKNVIEQPNAIKIDVDGPELAVLMGAKNALKDPRLKTVCFEKSTEIKDHDKAYEFLQSLGFEEDLEFSDKINAQFTNVFMFRK